MELSQNQIQTINNKAQYGGSDKYVQIPTSDIITKFQSHGFTISSMQQANYRKEEKAHKVKHLIRMQVPNYAQSSPVIPEIVIMNSSDSSSSLKLNFGAIRMACMNGLIYSDDLVPEERIKHTTKDPFYRIDAFVDSVLSSLHLELKYRQLMENQQLSLYDAARIAEYALTLRESSLEQIVDPLDLLTIQRREDSARNLWNIFNICQENLIKGEYRKYYESVDPDTQELSSIIKKTKVLTDKSKLITVNKQLHTKCLELVLWK